MTNTAPQRVTADALGSLVASALRHRADGASGPDPAASAASAGPEGSPLVVASGNCATPSVALRAIDAAVASYRLFVLNAHGDIPRRAGVIPTTPFVGPAMRGDPALRYLPCRLSLVPRLFSGPCRPDVVVVHTSVPVDGRVSLGTEVNILPAAVEAARAGGGLVVAQMNRRMPYTHGDAELPVEAIDAAIEVDLPLASPTPRPVDAGRAAIGERVAALVPDGATLQLGIGAVPDATLAALSGRRGLRIWTETFSDGVLDLEHAGALDADSALTTSFVLGSAELYRWIDRNPRVRLLRTETVNNPAEIARQRTMTSVNTALQVDLRAQTNASHVHGRIWSGFGGQPDFVAGALHAPDGHAIIALPSWHAKSGTSTIVPAITEPTTSFQHSYVVSEHGTAELWGRSQRDQADALIHAVADPRAREELTAALTG
ncbi:Acetyl-CoA hydrolase [Frankia canadensis]|uniref:Acetyl-CoA hydrolase n=1 Tax=Frankia canadensis TaxID=1836972 RepID=A0A2I2KT74_9ACTN|nr:acetyl-CoA hydrolase/transferase C-terminal domain-containing protein [Frankia canadensis]SNQ48874.1 Acetyl-CoA hydrolase [Frankia canadensis]SOU56164.1 Acetyl-CoA hydrolase [Frankia canadensis]